MVVIRSFRIFTFPLSQQPPLGLVLPSQLHDARGDAVKQKAQEEIREELEMQAMGDNDPAQQFLKRPMDGQQDESGQMSQHGAEN